MARPVVFCALVVGLQMGCAGKLAKANKSLAAYERGDLEALERAIVFADAAVDKAPDDPLAHSARGRASIAAAPADPQTQRLEVAVDSLERGSAPLNAGPPGPTSAEVTLHAELSSAVPRLEELLMQRLVNEVEARAWEPADRVLGLATRARAIATKVRGPDSDRDAALARVAAQVNAERALPIEARDQYVTYAKLSDRDDRPLACLVARALAARDVDQAVAFIGPLSTRYPDDETLLRTEVDILMGGSRTDAAVARIERALPTLEQSVSGAFLAASLFDAAGEQARARVAWDRVLALNPSHIDARVALGRSLGAHALAVGSEVRARSDELDQRRPPRDLLDLVASGQQAWRKAEELLVAAVAIDPRSRAAAAALVAHYEAQMSEFDQESTDPLEQQRLQAFQGKLSAAAASLAALESR